MVTLYITLTVHVINVRHTYISTDDSIISIIYAQNRSSAIVCELANISRQVRVERIIFIYIYNIF